MPNSPQMNAETIPVGDMVVVIESDDHIDPDSGSAKYETDDGGVEIDLNPTKKSNKEDEEFDSNLADYIDVGELGRIEVELLEGIEADDQSRQEWLETRANGIEMLGFRIDSPRSDAGSGAAPVEGMSTVRHPLLSEAVIRFQSNAGAELYPAEGPAKVRNDAVPEPPPDGSSPPPQGSALTKDDLAEALERDLNHYLTVVDKGYRQDSVRMLFWVGFGGCAFKKVYNDPIKRMPVSRSVDAADLIVSNDANEIDDAGRVTHKIKMRRSILKRMQIAGVYRDIDVGLPEFQQSNPVERTIDEVQGLQSLYNTRPEDQEYTIYECYCELDIKGYEHVDEDGKPTGLPLPYRVTIEKDSRRVLEVRRNWREDDTNMLARKVFVKFPFVPTMGFYDTGLLQILGNASRALTGAWRLMLDQGMFGNFPGFLYSDAIGRQVTNEFRVPPGGGVKINTGGKPIGDMVMPLPYKDVGMGLMQLANSIQEAGQRVGGTAELQVAEGRQDAPVGTTLAMIEQATKMLAAVHINLHAALAEELQLLKECFREDPESFWRHNRRPAHAWEVTEFLSALEDCDLVPASDPNTPSHMHRIMKAMAIVQMAQAAPGIFDPKAVATRVMRMLGIADPYALFNPNPAPPPNPNAAQDSARLQELQLKAQQMAQDQQDKQKEQQISAAQQAQELAAKHDAAQTESADRAADRASRERVAQMRENTERLKLLGELAQQGQVPSDVALSAGTGQPINQQPPQ